MTTTLALGMTTSPRVENYVGPSIDSLRAAGFFETLHVFAEPGAAGLAEFPDAVVHPNARTLGCAPNWKSMLVWLLENTSAEWLLLLQDDVIWHPEAAATLRAAIAAPERQSVGFLSAYTSPAMIPRKAAGGWQEALFPNPEYWGIKKFWGALAVAMPRGSALALSSDPRFQAHDHPRKLDELIGDCMHDLGRSCQVHVPSLADHIGEQSTLGRHKLRFFSNQWGRHGYRFAAQT